MTSGGRDGQVLVCAMGRFCRKILSHFWARLFNTYEGVFPGFVCPLTGIIGHIRGKIIDTLTIEKWRILGYPKTTHESYRKIDQKPIGNRHKQHINRTINGPQYGSKESKHQNFQRVKATSYRQEIQPEDILSHMGGVNV